MSLGLPFFAAMGPGETAGADGVESIKAVEPTIPEMENGSINNVVVGNWSGLQR